MRQWQNPQSIPECNEDQYDDGQYGSNNFSSDMTVNSNMEMGKLTSKKRQYLQDMIADKNGTYSYLEDPVEYKKARKRLQNRESAVRSRQRKKNY